MATQSELRQWAKATVTPRMLEQAYEAAETALALYTQPEEVRPGLHLCCRGRLYRAQFIAAKQPPEKWPALEAELQRLGAICENRLRMLKAAEQYYHDLCRRARVEPKLTALEPCTCEGCRMVEDAIAHIAGTQEKLQSSVAGAPRA